MKLGFKQFLIMLVALVVFSVAHLFGVALLADILESFFGQYVAIFTAIGIFAFFLNVVVFIGVNLMFKEVNDLNRN